MTDKEKVLTVWPKAVAARSMFIDRAWMITVEGRGRISERFDNIEAAWQNAAESLPARPKQESVIKSVTLSNPTLYTDPNNADHLSFTPFEPAAPVEAKEKERYEASDEYIRGFERCKELAEHIVDEHDGFLDRIGHLDPVTSVAEPKPTPSEPGDPRKQVIEPLIEEVVERKLLISAYDALRSYQYGNGSTDLAEEIANSIGMYFSGGRE